MTDRVASDQHISYSTNTLPDKSRPWGCHTTHLPKREGRKYGYYGVNWEFFFFSRPWSLPCTRSICFVSFTFPRETKFRLSCFLVFTLWSCIVGLFSLSFCWRLAALLYLLAIWQFTMNGTIFWIRFKNFKESDCPIMTPIRLCLETYRSWLIIQAPFWWQNRGQTKASAPYPSTTTLLHFHSCW